MKTNKEHLSELLKEFDNNVKNLDTVSSYIDEEYGYGGPCTEYIENVQDNWALLRNRIIKFADSDDPKDL